MALERVGESTVFKYSIQSDGVWGVWLIGSLRCKIPMVVRSRIVRAKRLAIQQLVEAQPFGRVCHLEQTGRQRAQRALISAGGNEEQASLPEHDTKVDVMPGRRSIMTRVSAPLRRITELR